MSGSNYPPGVTGNEYPISGPDSTEEVVTYCPLCEDDTTHTVETHPSFGVLSECDICHHQYDATPDEPDPDYLRDLQWDFDNLD